MDSQADSLDIPRLKRFALGLPETDVSQAFLSSEPDSQSSSSPNLHEQREAKETGKESATHRAASCSASSASLLAVHVFSASDEDAHVAGQNDTQLQQFLSSLPQSARSRMVSGDTQPGDTQPISQSVFESIMSRSKLLSTPQEGSHVDMKMNDQSTLQMTFKEGDPGHTDLLAGFGESNPSENLDNSDSVQSSLRPDSSPEHNLSDSQQFMATPYTVGKLQNGQAPASATPSLPRNPLATDLSSSTGGMMALSQVFRATQAPSSPFANGLPSGPLSDRPSPNIPIQSRPMQKFTSSPLRTPRSDLHRTHTDPHSYVSMDESQKQRSKAIEERRTRSMENIMSEDQSDDEFDKESSFVRRLRLQKRIDAETHARLAAVGRGSPRKMVADSSVSFTKAASQELATVVEGDTRPMASNEGISEEETEQEDNAVAADSQKKQHMSSSEEDKENYIGPPVDDMETISSAHDRLSQALQMSISPSQKISSQMEKDTLATENSHPASELIINVRDSQPSPSQGGPEFQQSVRPSSPQELVHSTPDDISPPAKRQRLQQDTDEEPNQSRVEQLSHRRSTSPSSVYSTARFSQQNTNASVPISSMKNANAAEKSSSMPSRVTNTPINKADSNNTIPETSIPESSPNGSRHEPRPAETTSQIPPIPEAEQEDDDLPTPHHQRNWDNFVSGPSPNGTPRSMKAISRAQKLFTSSSPAAGRIKSLSQLSAEHSPQTFLDAEVDIEILNAGDKEFSEVVDAFDHQTPTKKRRKTAGTTPLRSELSLSTTPKLDFNKTVSRSTQHEQPNDIDSPESTYQPAVVRRKRGRPRRSENIWDFEDTPPSAIPRLPKQRSFNKKAATTNQRLTISENNLSPQNSVSTEHSAPGRIEHRRTEISVEIPSYVPTSSGFTTPKSQKALPEESVTAPDQVLAPWNGYTRAYYPAKFLSAGAHQRCFVKFVDTVGERTDVALNSVKRLELRVGDMVKVDLPGFPKVAHVVRGFAKKLSVDELRTPDSNGSLPMTDIYGHSALILAAKPRKSPRRGGRVESDHLVEVPMQSIYLDMILWNQLKDRLFNVKMESISNRLQTPTRGISTPATPGSKLSRGNMPAQTGLFAGMVFAVSFGNQDATKTKITKLISDNGGRIVKEGFEELFEFPSSVPDATVSKKKSAQNKDTTEVQFSLAPGSEDIGFACLIADKHSRRAKYMQALALNIPCLSKRWVEDCVRDNRILDWSCYLLPAGESKFLDGAIKSRILTPTPAEEVKFSETITGRPKILEGQSVLLVMGGGKAEERRKAYLFLTYALGAARVERVFDLKSAKATLETSQKTADSGWDWLYVDDGEEAAATNMIQSRGQAVGSGVGRKRKRSSLLSKSANDMLEKDGGKVRVVSNDFVCQSLILGKIYEP